MMGDWRKKPQSKQNINPVGFPPIPPSMFWRVDCFLVSGQDPKTSRSFPYGVGGNPKVKRDKITNGKGHRSGKGNEHGKQKCVIKILKGGPGLKKW